MALKAYALTTVDRVKSFAGLTGLTAAQDTTLENIINALTEYVENYTGRRFQKTTYTEEEHNGTDTDVMLLDNYPVDGSVTVQSRSGESSWDSLDTSSYDVVTETGTVYRIGGDFVRGRLAYRATYDAGFDFDNAATFLSDTEAGDVEYVAWKMASEAWIDRKGGRPVDSERLGDYAVSFGKSLFELDSDGSHLKSILDRYKAQQARTYLTPTNT